MAKRFGTPGEVAAAVRSFLRAARAAGTIPNAATFTNPMDQGGLGSGARSGRKLQCKMVNGKKQCRYINPAPPSRQPGAWVYNPPPPFIMPPPPTVEPPDPPPPPPPPGPRGPTGTTPPPPPGPEVDYGQCEGGPCVNPPAAVVMGSTASKAAATSSAALTFAMLTHGAAEIMPQARSGYEIKPETAMTEVADGFRNRYVETFWSARKNSTWAEDDDGMRCTSTGLSQDAWLLWERNQTNGMATMVLGNDFTGLGLCIRHDGTDSPTGYYAYIVSDLNLVLYKITAGVAVEVGTATLGSSLNPGDTVRLRAAANTIEFGKDNDWNINFVDPSPLTSGRAGLFVLNGETAATATSVNITDL